MVVLTNFTFETDGIRIHVFAHLSRQHCPLLTICEVGVLWRLLPAGTRGAVEWKERLLITMVGQFRNKHPPSDYAADIRTGEVARKSDPDPRDKRCFVLF